jgi:hypothetical protein
MAKQNQGKVNPGEKVLIILENDEIEADGLDELIPDKVLQNKNLPNWKKWLGYFMGN